MVPLLLLPLHASPTPNSPGHLAHILPRLSPVGLSCKDHIGCCPIEMHLPKATYCTNNTGQDNLLHVIIEVYNDARYRNTTTTPTIDHEKANKDLVQQIEVKDNSMIEELSKVWDSMLSFNI